MKKTVLVTALMLETSVGVKAATINVDGANCTLANAIQAVNDQAVNGGCNAGTGIDVIELPENSTIELNSTLPSINLNSANLTLNCNNSTITRNINADDFAIISISTGGLDDITINDCVISNGVSTFTSINNGGGIAGVGAYSQININRSIITGNIGGGLSFSDNLDVSITDSIISDNKGHPTAFLGSAGLSFDGGTVSIVNSTISGNSTYSGARGGGILLREGYFLGDTSLTIINSTISNNSSDTGAGGIHIDANVSQSYGTTVQLTHVTLVNNTTLVNGGGLFNDDAEVAIQSSIISGNSANYGNNIYNRNTGHVNLSGFNLIGLNGDDGLYGLVFDNNSSNAVIQSPDLTDVLDTQLKNNGGYTPTHALVQDSVAMEFIPAGDCIVVNDQTGKTRPIDGNGDGVANCDAGAFESADLIFVDGFDG